MGKRLTIHDGPADTGDGLRCPAWLGKQGKAKWHETVALLREMDESRAQKVDGDFLALYCGAFDDLHEAMETMARDGRDCVGPNGALYPHPAVGRKNRAIETIRKFGRELGLNYASRKKTKTALKITGPVRMKPA